MVGTDRDCGGLEEPGFWEQPDQVERFAEREPDHRLLTLLDHAEPGRVRVLDLGCAGGRNTVVLAARGYDFYALDSAAAMVERTVARVAAIVGPTAAARRVKVGRMQALDFPDQSFHLVVALGVHHNARSRQEWDQALAETARVLAPGGRLLVSNFSPRSRPTGKVLTAVPNEPHVFEGFEAGRMYLLEADELDAAMARHGLVSAAPTRTVETPLNGGSRVTINGLYEKKVAAT